jgi:hypothetical protein
VWGVYRAVICWWGMWIGWSDDSGVMIRIEDYSLFSMVLLLPRSFKVLLHSMLLFSFHHCLAGRR